MEQNFNNHIRLVPGYHYVLGLLSIAGLIASIVLLVQESNFQSALIALLFVCVLLLGWFTRSFAIKAQDRAIRNEVNFRHYLLTQKPLPTLALAQIVGLRFAPDEELVELVQRAVKEKLSAKAIKQAIKNWKADHDRA